jgi:hypothetical protein
MASVSLFPRQIASLRRGEAGQAALLLIVSVAAILSLLFATIHVSHLGGEKVAAANAVDAIVLSAATWEARCLNVIAALNDGILQCLRAIRWTCVIWASLAVSALFGGFPAFAAYSREAPRIIRSYWKCARQLADWAEKVKRAAPYLVLAETAALSKTLNVAGILHPFDPRGPHDGRDTLELHLTFGPPLDLAEALGPIARIRNAIKKMKWAKKVAGRVVSVIDAALRSIAGPGGQSIRLLVPEDDFPVRQKVRFTGSRVADPLPIPYLNWARKERFFHEAHAEPYGGDTTRMTWKSRLIDQGGTNENDSSE